MSSTCPTVPEAGAAISNSSVSLRFLARQPILDAMGRVHAYELLFRSGLENEFRGDGDQATRTMIDNTVIFGLTKLTSGLPAFVNCTAHALMAQEVNVLPPSMTVLEILESVEPLPDLVAACCRLKANGYRIALDDFVYKPSLKPLIRLADYIKVDFLHTTPAERAKMLCDIGRYHGVLLAEKIETQAEYAQARKEGFTHFQGYYFCRPLLLSKAHVPPNRMVHLKLLQGLHEQPLDVPRISELVKRDASLTYRLLRLVNSPACPVKQEVRSIPMALMAIGDDLFRRIATLAVGIELNSGQTSELLRLAFVRARFCELVAPLCRLDPTEQYLLGIFSLLPSMLRAPMAEVIAGLNLSQDMHEALMGEEDEYRCSLTWIEAIERGDWEACDRMAKSHGLALETLYSHFAQAVIWADQILPAY